LSFLTVAKRKGEIHRTATELKLGHFYSQMVMLGFRLGKFGQKGPDENKNAFIGLLVDEEKLQKYLTGNWDLRLTNL